jgi:hypothetical protein
MNQWKGPIEASSSSDLFRFFQRARYGLGDEDLLGFWAAWSKQGRHVSNGVTALEP